MVDSSVNVIRQRVREECESSGLAMLSINDLGKFEVFPGLGY